MENFDFEKLANVILAFIEAPTWKAVVVIVGIIALCMFYIALYFYKENKRREEAYKEAIRVKQLQEKNIERMQLEVSQAIKQNMDVAYKQDFDYYKDCITQGKYLLVWGKIPAVFREKVLEFIYREDLSPEDKSARIIQVVRNK